MNNFSLVDEIKRIPFFRLAVPFILGIVIQLLWSIEQQNILNILIILLLLSILILHNKTYNLITTKILGLLIMSILLILGMITTLLKQNIMEQNIEWKGSEKIIGTVYEPIVEKPNSVKAIIESELIHKDQKWHHMKKKLIIYFQKDSNILKLQAGDRIAVWCNINEIQASSNPSTFNYKKYTYYNGITLSAYAKNNQWIKLKEHSKSIRYQLYRIRALLLKQYNDYGIKGNEHAVLAALTLGYTNEINDEIMSSFSATGAMHVLSVSGLHVAIVYYLLSVFIFLGKKKKYLRIPSVLFVIVSLWFYALMTGFSPSVIRSSIMFSFIATGSMFKRPLNTLNSVFASAFFMLLINPFQITNIGFQLSYLAVIGILLLYKQIYNLFCFKNWIANQAWMLISVSLAAQIVNTPLCLYYFHSFPNYFILTNLIVIPLTTLILYTGLGLPLLTFIKPLAEFISFILNYLLIFLNKSLYFIEHLPYATFKNISISEAIVILLYILLIAIVLYFRDKTYKSLRFILLILLIICIGFTYKQIEIIKQKKLIVYQIKNESAIEIVSKNKGCMVYNSLNNSQNAYCIKELHIMLGVNDTIQPKHKMEILGNNIFMEFSEKRFIVLRNNLMNKYQSTNKLQTNYIIITNSFRGKIEEIQNLFRTDLIIIDSSVPMKYAEKYEQECIQQQQKCYNVSRQGAYFANL